RAARDVADRDLHVPVRFRRVPPAGGQRVGALSRGAVGVVEVDLDELPRDEVQGVAVAAPEGKVRDRGRQHAPAGQDERELDDGQGEMGRSGPGMGRWGAYTNRRTPHTARPDASYGFPRPQF